MALQFVTVIVLARRLSPVDVGVYFEVFGAVNATYFLAGFGLPDGLVKSVAELRAGGDLLKVRVLLRKSAFATAVLSLLVAALAVLFFARHGASNSVALLAAGWWLCYAAVFFGSQALVALGRTSSGAFFFYPATSLALFAFCVPYLLGSAHPTVKGVMVATLIGSGICAIAVTVCLATSWRELPITSLQLSLRPLFQLGILIGLGRVLQTSLYWIPVWIVGVLSSAAAAGAMGTASRINAAIAAVMAAIRFTIRPTIVRHATRNEWPEIAKTSQQVASAATATAILSVVITLTIGPWLVNLVFGHDYEVVALLVAAMLIGTIGECIGGPVDEILKMTNRAHVVIAALLITTAAETALVWIAARHSTVAMALGQSVAIAGMFAALLWIVWRRDHVYVGARVQGLQAGLFLRRLTTRPMKESS